MPADLALNTYTPYRWARVVSGETWAEYTVGAAGLIEAQTVRGPLIVWATKTGEGESLPHLHAPTLSPLEVQAARVNTRAHLHGFVRAARLPSRVGGVRWKTWAKARKMRAVRALEDVRHAAQHAARYAALYAALDEDAGRRALHNFLRLISESYEEAATIDPLLYLSLTVQVIEAAARRALWAARRVRPTFPPRTRLPRPLYARPCPPAAPLAPPVA